MDDDKGFELSDDAWRRLRQEQAFLEQARTLFRKGSDDVLVQLAFAENQSESDSVGVIRQFVALLDKGITPPPHILAAIAAGFRIYLKEAGHKTIDQSFGLEAKQRAGHPLAHRAEKERRGQIAYVMWYLRREANLKGKRLSIEAAAGEVINRLGLPYSEDVLKKHYCEINADTIFDQAAEVMRDFGSVK